MPIHYPDVLDQGSQPRAFSYGEKDAMLYALGIGLGGDPMDEAQLAFVAERRGGERPLRVVPTAVTVLAANAGRGEPLPTPPGHRPSAPDPVKLVHGEQRIELHRPLPASGTFTTASRTIGAFDKGADKGAVLVHETRWTDADGAPVATLTGSTFCRGDGGFDGPSEGAPEPHPTPGRAPDISVDLPTRPDQALLYRLNGDRNPLHSDPGFARRAGFPRPILHGLCTFGLTCRAVLQAVTGYDPEPIASHQARFSAPVFPGDMVTVDLWCDGREVAFEARVKARNAVVIRNGLTRLR